MSKYRAQFAQHFLHSSRLVNTLIGHSNLKSTDTVYDLGAGNGVISVALSKRVKQIFAVEIEPVAIGKLQENTRGLDNIEIIKSNILDFDIPRGKYKIFANIPFQLSSPILRKYVYASNTPEAIYIIVQKQFAYKLLTEKQGFTNQLGAEIAPWFSARVRMPLKRSDYWPMPNVDTVFLEVLPRQTPLVPTDLRQDYIDFVRKCYTNPNYFLKLKTPTNKPSEMNSADWVELFKDNLNS